MIGQTPSVPEPSHHTDPETQSPENATRPDGPVDAGTDVRKEIGGRDGPEPTRYGDWEKNGRCIDF